jgi:Lipocalin-like domain
LAKVRTSLAAFVLLIALTGKTADTKPAQVSTEPDIKNRFIGMWRLVSVTDPNGRITHPTGIIVYDASGNMAAQIMDEATRPKFASPTGPTADEAKAALSGYLAYFGTYTIDPKATTITHHVKADINPGFIGVDRVRKYEFSPDGKITLITVAPFAGGSLTWERVK